MAHLGKSYALINKNGWGGAVRYFGTAAGKKKGMWLQSLKLPAPTEAKVQILDRTVQKRAIVDFVFGLNRATTKADVHTHLWKLESKLTVKLRRRQQADSRRATRGFGTGSQTSN
eukprot:Platyproteum_vivax@DN2088_c0_g1_i1.p1